MENNNKNNNVEVVEKPAIGSLFSLRVLEFFSGIGGMRVALKIACDQMNLNLDEKVNVDVDVEECFVIKYGIGVCLIDWEKNILDFRCFIFLFLSFIKRMEVEIETNVIVFILV